MKYVRDKISDQTGALQSGGIHALAAFVVFGAMFFWVPYLWSQSIITSLLFILSSLGASLAASLMMEVHEADRPVAIVLSVFISVLSILNTIIITITLKQGTLTDNFGAGSAIYIMHLPLFAGCAAVLIIGKIETRAAARKEKLADTENPDA